MLNLFNGIRSAFKSLYHSHFSLPDFSGYEKFCVNDQIANSISLDLGCGKTPRNPFQSADLFGVDVDYGVDESKRVLRCDLGMEALPFADGYFDYVTAFDLIEHIPRTIYKGERRHSPFIFLMNEVYRVLKEGGTFLSHTPAYPRMAAFTDPTHVNVISPMTFKLYFCRPYSWATRYGFVGSFDLRRQGWHGDNIVAFMTKSPDRLALEQRRESCKSGP